MLKACLTSLGHNRSGNTQRKSNLVRAWHRQELLCPGQGDLLSQAHNLPQFGFTSRFKRGKALADGKGIQRQRKRGED